jgi:protein-S-isoprenylcysteine O-methyltransferase Ste14
MRKIVLQQAAEIVLFFGLFAAALFIPAGTLNWPAGWFYLALFFGFYVSVTLWLYRHDPALMQERSRMGTRDQPGWDRLLFPAMLVLSFVWMAAMALDAERFHWSVVPFWLQAGGGVLLLGSFYMLFLTFRENTFLSTVVRIQSERGHSVISTGPYGVVRHPMYLAILVFLIGTSLLLGAWSGLALGLVYMLVLARRAVLEERTLAAQLSGYAQYMQQVKFRLIPFIW